MSARVPGLIAVVLCGLMCAFTSHKLYSMCQIRGWIAGRELVEAPVTSKRVSHSVDGSSTFYDVSWGRVEGVEASGSNVPKELYDGLTPHASTIELAIVGGEAHVVGGIYASNGNFGFDGFLLLLWIGGIVWGARRLLQGEGQAAPVAPVPVRAPPATFGGGWTAVVPSSSWFPLGYRLLWGGLLGFGLGCTVAIEGFGLVPAPWYSFVPPALVGLAAAYVTYRPPWDHLLVDGEELGWSRERGRPLTWRLSEVLLVVGEHGLDVHQTHDDSFFFWRWLRVVTATGEERIELSPRDNRACFERLRSRCPQAVAITPDGVAHRGPEADPRAVSLALSRLRRRTWRAWTVSAALAIALVAGLVQEGFDWGSLVLWVTVAAIAIAFARQGLVAGAAQRRAQAALRGEPVRAS